MREASTANKSSCERINERVGRPGSGASCERRARRTATSDFGGKCEVEDNLPTHEFLLVPDLNQISGTFRQGGAPAPPRLSSTVLLHELRELYLSSFDLNT